jgi:hypothetical protein
LFSRKLGLKIRAQIFAEATVLKTLWRAITGLPDMGAFHCFCQANLPIPRGIFAQPYILYNIARFYFLALDHEVKGKYNKKIREIMEISQYC